MADAKLTDLPVYGAVMDGTEVMYMVPASGLTSNQITTAKLIEDLNALTTLDELGDVTITTVQNGEILQWNGSAWVNAAQAGGGDVTGPAGGVVDNEIALYNSTTGKIIKGSGGAVLADYAALASADFTALSLGGEPVTTINQAHNEDAGTESNMKFAALTQAQYDGLTPDADTIYFITT